MKTGKRQRQPPRSFSQPDSKASTGFPIIRDKNPEIPNKWDPQTNKKTSAKVFLDLPLRSKGLSFWAALREWEAGGYREEGTPAFDPPASRPEGEPTFFLPGSPAFSYHATLCGKSRRRRLSHPALFLAPTRLPFRWDCSLAAPHPQPGLEEGRGKDASWEAELRLSFCWGLLYLEGRERVFGRKPWLCYFAGRYSRDAWLPKVHRGHAGYF